MYDTEIVQIGMRVTFAPDIFTLLETLIFHLFVSVIRTTTAQWE